MKNRKLDARDLAYKTWKEDWEKLPREEKLKYECIYSYPKKGRNERFDNVLGKSRHYIHRSILKKITETDFSKLEYKLVIYFLMNTYGFTEREMYFSYDKGLAKKFNTGDKEIRNTIIRLLSWNVLNIVETREINLNTPIYKYRLNLNFNTWKIHREKSKKKDNNSV